MKWQETGNRLSNSGKRLSTYGAVDRQDAATNRTEADASNGSVLHPVHCSDDGFVAGARGRAIANAFILTALQHGITGGADTVSVVCVGSVWISPGLAPRPKDSPGIAPWPNECVPAPPHRARTSQVSGTAVRRILPEPSQPPRTAGRFHEIPEPLW